MINIWWSSQMIHHHYTHPPVRDTHLLLLDRPPYGWNWLNRNLNPGIRNWAQIIPGQQQRRWPRTWLVTTTNTTTTLPQRHSVPRAKRGAVLTWPNTLHHRPSPRPTLVCSLSIATPQRPTLRHRTNWCWPRTRSRISRKSGTTSPATITSRGRVALIPGQILRIADRPQNQYKISWPMQATVVVWLMHWHSISTPTTNIRHSCSRGRVIGKLWSTARIPLNVSMLRSK